MEAAVNDMVVEERQVNGPVYASYWAEVDRRRRGNA